MISQQKISEVIAKIVSGYQPEKIILFGSYARGNPHPHSDLDVLVIKDSSLARPIRTSQVRKLLYGAQVPLDLMVYTPAEINQSKDNPFSFLHEILKSGKTVYERSN